MTTDADRSPAPETPRPPRPGLTTFTIEGRTAPALFVIGWIATLLGLGITIAAVGAQASPVLVAIGLVLLSIGLISAAGSQAIERRVRGDEGWTGPSPVLLFAATIPATFFIAIVVGALLSAAGLDASRPAGDLLLLTLQAATYIGLVALLVVGTGALRWRDMGFGRPLRLAVGDVAWGALLAGPVILVTSVASFVLVSIFGVVPESPLPPTDEPGGLVFHLIAGALVAPISEEILFRGVGTTAWVRSRGLWPGIIRSAIFFAVVHVLLLSGSSVGEAFALAVVGFAGRLPVAIALGWVYVRRQSIYASIALHAAFNGALILLAYAAPPLPA